MNFFFSTSCLSIIKEFSQILKFYSDLGIKNVELGVCLDPKVDYRKIIKEYDFNYVIHHLFPPSEEIFVINLASESKNILNKSLNQIFRTIDFCANNNIPFFSFHSGFRADPDLNFKFKFYQISEYEKSFYIFKESLMKILQYSKERDIKIGIENNVLAEYNLVNGHNEILLMCESWEYKKLFNEIDSKRIGILLDLGHLNVTSETLKFDKNLFIKKLKNHVFALHIHENDGKKDEHRKINKDDWSVSAVKKYFSEKEIPIVLESKFSSRIEFESYLDLFYTLF